MHNPPPTEAISLNTEIPDIWNRVGVILETLGYGVMSAAREVPQAVVAGARAAVTNSSQLADVLGKYVPPVALESALNEVRALIRAQSGRI